MRRLLLLFVLILCACESDEAEVGDPPDAPDAIVADMASAGDLSPEPGRDQGADDVGVDMSDEVIEADMSTGRDEEIALQSGSVVSTTHGQVEGSEEGDLRVFKGIPFAQPPVGALRFRRPRKMEPWDGSLDATEFGPSCLQSTSFNSQGTSEDCLTLNVWGHLDDTPRPVMVWIYGGGFIAGETAMNAYDGADLAEQADVVVVSINYRLGALGNLALPELRDEDPMGAVGNMGLLDQIAALEWVRDNAAAFGGDPDNITVFGESAGGISTCALIGAPVADELFHKAIIQSGNCALFTQAEGEGGPIGGPSAMEYGERLAQEVGCPAGPERLSCLRELEGEDLIDAVEVQELTNILEVEAVLGWTIDGVVLPTTPYERILSGEAPDRPVLGGSTGNEAFIFTVPVSIWTRGDFEDAITPLVRDEDTAAAIVDLYSIVSYPIAKDAYNAFVGELMFGCNTHHALRAMSSGYHYELELAPATLMTTYGPMHGADIFYVFGNFISSGIVPTLFDLDLQREVQQAWGSFARTGIPSWSGGWQPTTWEDPHHLAIGLVSEMESDFRSGRCDRLRELGVLP